MLLGEIDRELVHDVSGVPAQRSEQRAIPVHDDEAKLLVGFKQFAQGLGVEFVIAQVERRVDRFERLEIDVDLPLLAFGGDDFAAVDDQSIWRDFVVKLQALLGGRDG